jgi:hypothetical protein
LIAFVTFAFGSDEFLTLPLGVLGPLFHLNLNVHLARDLVRLNDLRYSTFLCAAAILSYAITGWITGAVAAVCFNFTAKWTGGISAKFVSVSSDAAFQK